MSIEALLTLVLTLAATAIAVIWWRSRRARQRTLPPHTSGEPGGTDSSASSSTGPTELSRARHDTGDLSSLQYEDFLAAAEPPALSDAAQPSYDYPYRGSRELPGSDPAQAGDLEGSQSGASTYGHVFDSLIGDGLPFSPPEPGTRALRSLAPGGASLVMTRATHKVGRSRSNDLMLDDPSVSRVHATFHVTEDGEYEVRDLQSLNGLFINGRKLRQSSLRPGDRVELGDARLDYIAIALGDS